MRFLNASRIFDGNRFLPESYLLAIENNGFIKDVLVKDAVDPLMIETFDGTITPGFINAHCHLELSHLKNIIPMHSGIVDFGLAIIKYRNEVSYEMQEECMRLADAEMKIHGIVAVGDISNTNLSIAIKKDSDLYYHTFVELMALNPQRADLVINQGNQLLEEFEQFNLKASLAPHAPYTASLELIKQIVGQCKKSKQPTSIHNQESKAENDFFQFKSGDYLRMYETLNISIDYFEPTQKSSLQSVLDGFDTNVKSLLVHNTFSSEDDIFMTQEGLRNVYWCLCPSANLYIENALPDLNLLLTQNCQLTIGTDSLASNQSLSVIKEVNTLLSQFPNVSLETLLRAATYNGAKFLGIENTFGTIEKNKKPGINLLERKNDEFVVKKLL